MAAFVVTSPDSPVDERANVHLNIFPGSAIPTVFPARTPFRIGYGFTVEAAEPDESEQPELSPETRFVLVVDGAPVALATDTRVRRGRTVSRHSVATFDAGLPPGWHRFEGRWYDAGVLALASDTRIEFVER